MDVIQLKVCGMRDRRNILEVMELKPDFMGFIFYRDSPRFVGDDFMLPADLSPATKKVGVFVNESNENIKKKITDHRLDFVQLHGHESVEQCRELKSTGIGIIKVFSVDDKADFKMTEPYKSTVDYFLFDTKGKYFGGNARRFNWEILARYDQEIPFFLSGGIGPEHVAEIRMLRDYNLQAIDVNSGVEISAAFKDVNKIKEIKEMLNIKQ